MPKHSGWKYGDRGSRGITDVSKELVGIRALITELNEDDQSRPELIAQAAALAALLDAKEGALPGKSRKRQRANMLIATQGHAALRGAMDEATQGGLQAGESLFVQEHYVTRATPQQIQSFLEENAKKSESEDVRLGASEALFLGAMSQRLPQDFSPLDYFYTMQSLIDERRTGVDRNTGQALQSGLASLTNDEVMHLEAETPKMLAVVIGADFGAEIAPLCQAKQS